MRLCNSAAVAGHTEIKATNPLAFRFVGSFLQNAAGAAETISTLLRHQYVIRYVPGNPTHDGKWRKVKVKVNPPPGVHPVSVYARFGYYAPSQ